MAVASTALCAAAPAAASAINLEMSQGAAFDALGHWCGGIKEKVYETGFAASGYPQGNVFMETTCGGSGKGGGGGHTTYTGTASVVWTWLGETWKWGPMVGTLESKPAEDSHKDKLFNVTPCNTGYLEGTCAVLETGEPPYQAPAAPSDVSASAYLAGNEVEYLYLAISWGQDTERGNLLTKQTVRIEPLEGRGSPAEEEVRTYFSGVDIGPVEPNERYKISVTQSDNEGTSLPGTVEFKTPNADGETEKEQSHPVCGQDYGTIAMKPGLTETAKVQTVTVSGTLVECGGTLGESATYVTKFKTAAPVTCGVLNGTEQIVPATGALTIQWSPAEEGASKGSIAFPLGEGTLAGLSGVANGGPLSTETTFKTAYTGETFTGGSSCGVKVGKKAAKPVKSGSFSAPDLEFG
jgi:hypothetical protein